MGIRFPNLDRLIWKFIYTIKTNERANKRTAHTRHQHVEFMLLYVKASYQLTKQYHNQLLLVKTRGSDDPKTLTLMSDSEKILAEVTTRLL